MIAGENIEEQLRPFQENNMGDCPQEYLEFNDIEAECTKDYKTDTTSVFISPDGKAYFKYDGQFRNATTGESECPTGWATDDEYPVKDLYSLEEYIEDYVGYKKDDITGKYGYWENPNAKWDWYQVGGRWAGMFKIKPEYQELYIDKVPNFSWGWDEESKREVFKNIKVDSAVKKHIDFEAIMYEAGEKARGEYRKYRPFLDIGDREFIPWSLYLERVNDENDDLEREEARNLYHGQPQIIAKKENCDKLGDQSVFVNLGDFYNITEEEYVENARIDSLMTFAFIKDGKWCERGKMGWFACVSDEKDKETWESIFKKFIDGIGEDEVLTVVDCHI